MKKIEVFNLIIKHNNSLTRKNDIKKMPLNADPGKKISHGQSVHRNFKVAKQVLKDNK